VRTGYGDLQHRQPGQPAEHRLHHDLVAGRLRALEVVPVAQVELARRAERIAEQLAVGDRS
jgi:hypothetical protein